MFKIEVENGKGIWSDVRADDGPRADFESEETARCLAERFPVLVKWNSTPAAKRTRVIRILETTMTGQNVRTVADMRLLPTRATM
jgi:hypothetical protein